MPDLCELEPISRHGDLLYAFYDEARATQNGTPQQNGASISGDLPMSTPVDTPEPSGPTASEKRPREPVKQDAVDDILENQDGKIPRQRDPKMCKHGPKGMCDYCMPLEVLPFLPFLERTSTNLTALRPEVPR